MTNYMNDIMDLLQGDTPRKKYEHLKKLIKDSETLQQIISDSIE